MTCIIGVIDEDNDSAIYMGGDSFISGDHPLGCPTPEPKIFHRGNFVLGVSGLVSVSQFIKYIFEIPEIQEDCEIERYLIAKFIPSLKKQLSSYDLSLKKDDSTSTVIIGGYKRLFRITPYYTLSENSASILSIGSGCDTVTAAYLAQEGLNRNIKDRILKSLEISEQCLSSVSSPFYVKKLDNTGFYSV